MTTTAEGEKSNEQQWRAKWPGKNVSRITKRIKRTHERRFCRHLSSSYQPTRLVRTLWFEVNSVSRGLNSRPRLSWNTGSAADTAWSSSASCQNLTLEDYQSLDSALKRGGAGESLMCVCLYFICQWICRGNDLPFLFNTDPLRNLLNCFSLCELVFVITMPLWR